MCPTPYVTLHSSVESHQVLLVVVQLTLVATLCPEVHSSVNGRCLEARGARDLGGCHALWWGVNLTTCSSARGRWLETRGVKRNLRELFL